MALHDWNHDGKKDMVDNYMEYQIYKETTGKSRWVEADREEVLPHLKP